MSDAVELAETVAVAYRTSGTGLPLMLIAGTGYAGDTWRLPDLMTQLESARTVITFDHRGTGQTPGAPGEYSTRLFAADAARLIDELGTGPVDAIGHSMGGRVLQWLLLDRPDLVRKAVMAATGPGQFDPSRPVTRGIPLKSALTIAEDGFEAYIRFQIGSTFFTPEFRAAHPDRVEWLIHAYLETRPSLEDYFKHVIARQGHETTDRLVAIAHPCLVLVGDRDTHPGGTGSHWEQSRYLAEHVPNATFKSVPDCAHGYFWQAPEESARIVLEWLAAQ
ncbi:MAG: alpha/beta hydrolase [Candidatus Limnocylindrales bacterium]